MPLSWSIFAICCLAAATAFFYVNNLSLRTFSRVKLQETLKAHNKEALFDKMLSRLDDLILTCSVLGKLSNISILAILITVFETNIIVSVLIAFVIFVVFSVAIPHSWAKYTSQSILPVTYPFLVFCVYLSKPILYFLKLHDKLVRRLAGVQNATPDQAQEEKQEELLSVVEHSRLEGVVDEEQMEMIENVLELSDTTAEQIMTPRTDLVSVSVDVALDSLVKTIAEAGHSRIPVYEENVDNIIGLIYAKDLLTEIGHDPAEFKIREKLRQAYFVPESKPLRDLLHDFQTRKLHIAVVLDEYGGTAGIVTIEDILEELVGEIVDEYEDVPAESVKQLDENTIEVDARVYIDDLNEDFELDLPDDEDYDTIGGFVFSHLGYIPKTGKNFEYENLKFTITLAEARRIKRIKIKMPSAGENGQ